MAGTGFGSSAEGTPLQMPVMDNAMLHINPVYTQAPTDDSMSPLAAYREYVRSGLMPAQQSTFKPFVAPQMRRVSMQTFTPRPALFSGAVASDFGGSGGDSFSYGGGGGWERGDQASGVTVGGPMGQDITSTDLGTLDGGGDSGSSGGK